MFDAGRVAKVTGSTGLQLLGLAGLCDSIVQWNDFVQAGILNHYDQLKATLLFWIPPVIRGYPIDYLVVGGSVFFAKRMQFEDERQFYASKWGNMQTWDDQDNFGISSKRHRIKNYLEAFFLWPIHVGMMIPVVLRDLFVSDARFAKQKGWDPESMVRSRAGRFFLIWLLTVWVVFVGLLFVWSDALSRFL